MTSTYDIGRKTSIGRIGAAGAIIIFAVSQAGATPITFAQYVETNGAQNWNVTESSSGGMTTTTVTATGEVYFSFQGSVAEPLEASRSWRR
jgi:hypothetical protein